MWLHYLFGKLRVDDLFELKMNLYKQSNQFYFLATLRTGLSLMILSGQQQLLILVVTKQLIDKLKIYQNLLAKDL